MRYRLRPLILWGLALVAITAGGWWGYERWRAQERVATSPGGSLAAPGAPISATDKIIVGDQAQKNLGLTAKPLKADEFWKTIAVQGMVVDRPGVSDQEVVAPAVGTITQIFHVPGETVRPGDVLITLKLASESLHQAQSELFKTSKNIELAVARHKRLAAAGSGVIPQATLIEAENEVARLEAAALAYRKELSNRGFSQDEIKGVADGKLLSEIGVVVPAPKSAEGPLAVTRVSASDPPPPRRAPLALFEIQALKVELGEQVQAGQALCQLSNHQLIAIEGRAFRDETSLLEQSIKEGWPVDVDFQEDASSDWPPIDQTFPIRYIANTIDPVTRTFAFLMPLENQYKIVDHGDRTQLLWRFRPGQKVRLRIRVEKLDNVFVLPADAVVLEGPEAFIFTQNVNTFERKAVHVLFRDRDQVVLANDGSLPTYTKGKEHWTIAAVVRQSAAQLNRMSKAGSSGVPKGYHIHADGSLHKNEDEAK